eukprot:7052336-Lingulodinium_polyedra.AAC.1
MAKADTRFVNALTESFTGAQTTRPAQPPLPPRRRNHTREARWDVDYSDKDVKRPSRRMPKGMMLATTRAT